MPKIRSREKPPPVKDIFLQEDDEIEITQSAIQLESLIGQFMFSLAGNNDDEGN